MHACVLYIGGHCRGRPSPVTPAQRPSGSQPETKGGERVAAEDTLGVRAD